MRDHLTDYWHLYLSALVALLVFAVVYGYTIPTRLSRRARVMLATVFAATIVAITCPL